MTGLHLSAMIETARAQREAGKLTEAIGILGAVLQAVPGNGRAHHETGLAMIAAGLIDGVAHLDTAVRIEPTNAGWRADLGEARIAAGDGPRGVESLQAAVALTPVEDGLLLRLGKGLGRTGRIDEADVWMRRVLGLRRPLGEAHVARGLMLHGAGRFEEAMKCFYRSVVEDQSYTEGFVTLAGALQEAGAPLELVMKPARIAAERIPDLPAVVIPVVQYLRDIGEEAEAVRFCTRLIDAEMSRAAADEFGALGFRVLFPDELTTRIGEMAHQLELHVKMKLLGWLPPFVTLLIAPRNRVVNPCLLDYWRQYITVIDDPKLVERIEPLKRRIPFNPVYMRLPDGRAMSKNRVYHAVQEEWQRQGRGPLLDLRRDHAERGQESLRRLGVPVGAWFVCVHVRESGYLREDHTSPEAARNADIHAFFPAIEAITRRGGWVVRLGDSTMAPLPAMANVVDYALSAERSDWMDVFLAASCRFILATTSGMMVVGLNFGVPVAATNFFPPGDRMAGTPDLFIPKLIRKRQGGRFLSFDESMQMPLALTYDARRLVDRGLEAVDSEAEDILTLTEEMLEKVDNRVSYSAEDEALQRRWLALLHPYSVGEAGARVGRGFLRRHRRLFRSW